MKIAIIRVRGCRNINPKIKKTLELLNLRKPNHCVVMDDNPYIKGMLNLAKDYVTFGPITEESLVHLITKRGKKGAKRITEIYNEVEIKEIAKKIAGGAKVRDFVDPVFTLKPPSGGKRKIKQPYPVGELGARPDMSQLVRKMA